jgi:cell division protein FtsW (lipid II flippase)
MHFSIFVSSLDPQKEFNELSKSVVEKIPFTKGTGLVCGIALIILGFILAYSKIPYIQESVSLTQADLRTCFWVVVITAIILSILFIAPEIIKRWRNSLKD